MLILAIDTSTDQASLGLLQERAPRAEFSWTASSNHSAHLSRLLDVLIETENLTPTEIHAVAVATGPGSFSGLRVGLSFAKGLALSLDVPLIGVGTLDVIAFSASCLGGTLIASLPAGRGQIYAARYTSSEGNVVMMGHIELTTPVQAANGIMPGTVLCGPGAASIAAAGGATAGEWVVEPDYFRLRRATYLAELCRRCLAAGGEDQRHTLEPLYVRRSAAEERRLAGGE